MEMRAKHSATCNSSSTSVSRAVGGANVPTILSISGNSNVIRTELMN